MRKLVRAVPAITVFLILVCFLHVSAQQEDKTICIGESVKIASAIQDVERELTVSLPENYAESEDSYPVLYVFGAEYDESFLNAVATARFMNSSGLLPEMIIVGIHMGLVQNEQIPADRDGVESEEAVNFGHFVFDELKPFVEKTYRVNGFDMAFGQSNNGLCAIYVYLTRPGCFDAVITASPSIGWCAEFMIGKAVEALKKPEFGSGFLYMNYGEHDYDGIVKSAMPQWEKTFQENAADDFIWTLEYLEGEWHVPVTTLHDGLARLFSGWKIPGTRAMELGLDGIKDHYNGLSDTFGFTVLPPQSVLIDYGFDLLENGDSTSAMQVLNYNIGLRPDSSFGHYILGIAHYRLEDVPAAVEELEIASKLDPENQRLRSVLQRIQNELKETGEEQH